MEGQTQMENQFKTMMEAVQHFAPVVARYFASLVEAGLTRQEALALAVEWQKVVLATPERPTAGPQPSGAKA
mgnify:CR=1 FL=1